MKILVYTVIVLLLSLFCQLSVVKGNCSSIHSTCGNCSIDSNCLWCLDPPGCMHKTSNCKRRAEIRNKVLSRTSDGKYIDPERLSLQLIPGVEEVIDFEVTQFEEYPVDLYFLVDLSWSMSGARDNIAVQGENIVREISKLTQNLRIGFGSFIEKNVPPFTSAIPRFNCPANPNNCSVPYSFHHQMSMQKLSPDTFRDKIMLASLGGNVDEPEASFDGLVQAMACHNEVGWRNNSRKIILLTTDGDFHFALDGKLIGLLEPSDGNCHLNSQGYFTEENVMDYPSISQLDAIASSGSYTLIFAVASRYHEIYRQLSKQIDGSSVAFLEKDAKNIVDIIKDIYKKITTTVQVSLKRQESVGDGNYTVKIEAKCEEEFKTINGCSNVKVGTPVQFKAIVKLNSCFVGRKSFFVKVVGLPKSMKVDLESKCNCDCENSSAPSSKECNFNGIFQCGVCYCRRGFMGSHCDCENQFTIEEQNEACVNPQKSEGGVSCSNKGKCICGECTCSDPFYGTYCQCDDSSCPLSKDGEICSNNGKCVCNKCNCDPQWKGLNCGCSKKSNNCRSPFNGRECSNNGHCECNTKCNCKKDFSGKYCQILPKTSDSCSLLRNCVENQLFGEESHDEDSKKECSVFQIVYVSPSELKSSAVGDLCVFTREKDGCNYEFEAKLTSSNKLIVYAVEDKESRCSYYSVDYLTISLSAVGATILLGLLGIIAYKLYIAAQDKREYERFKIQQKNSNFALSHNALYKNPVSQFQNPTYRPSRPSGK